MMLIFVQIPNEPSCPSDSGFSEGPRDVVVSESVPSLPTADDVSDGIHPDSTGAHTDPEEVCINYYWHGYILLPTTHVKTANLVVMSLKLNLTFCFHNSH